MKSRIILLALLGILLASSFVYSYGVTRPLPYELELLRGEEGRFKFQVQIVPSESTMECSYHIVEGFPFQVDFLQETVTVSPGQRTEVVAIVTVPRNYEFGSYSGDVCVTCLAIGDQAGTVVKQDVCSVLPKVNVVQTRTRDNMLIPVEESPLSINTTMLIIGSIIVIAGIIIVIFIMHKKKK